MIQTEMSKKEKAIAEAALRLSRVGFNGMDAIAIAVYSYCADGDCMEVPFVKSAKGYVCDKHKESIP